MPTIREWLHRLLGTLRPRRDEADLQEELRLHMALAAEDAQRRGQPVRAARLHTGGATQAMDALRDQRGWPWLQSVFADVVFACRQLKKHRTATAAAVLSLGLAVGATTAAFKLLDAVFWRALPIVQPERFFALGWDTTTSRGEPDYGTISTTRHSAAIEPPWESGPRSWSSEVCRGRKSSSMQRWRGRRGNTCRGMCSRRSDSGR